MSKIKLTALMIIYVTVLTLSLFNSAYARDVIIISDRPYNSLTQRTRDRMKRCYPSGKVIVKSKREWRDSTKFQYKYLYPYKKPIKVIIPR